MPTKASKGSRELQRVRYFENPDNPSRVTSSLKVTKVSPDLALEMIRRTPAAGLDFENRYPCDDPNRSNVRTRDILATRSTLDLLHLYY